MAADTRRGVVVLFGGARALTGAMLDETWEWDGATWRLIPTAPGPGPVARSGHAMAYDARRGRVVLFGGVDRGGRLLGDTWEWDGARWIAMAPAASLSARNGAVMTFDRARNRVLLFGGRGGPLALGDFWAWDGAQWLPLASGPPGRRLAAFAYDGVRGRAVLFGGFDGFRQLDDLWEWDGVQWSNPRPAFAPPAVGGAGMCEYPARGSVVLPQVADRIWEWDGTGWRAHANYRSQVPPGPTVFDPARAATLTFSTRQIWAWDGTVFGELQPTGPAPEGDLRLVDDDRRGVVVAVTNDDPYLGTRVRTETWEWNGVVWNRRSPAVSPPLRSGACIAYDRSRGRVVLFGGRSGATLSADVWEWDGQQWRKPVTTGGPTARAWASAAYDTVRQRVVVHGGGDGVRWLVDTWEWDGIGWRQVSAAGPASENTAMVCHEALGVLVLHGGRPNETWTWDGRAWRRRSVGSTAQNLWQPQLAYDAHRERVVLFGGYDGGYPVATWEWNGAWVRRGDAPALGRQAHGMAYDRARRRVIVAGGQWQDYSQFSQALSDTWDYAPVQPAAAAPYGVGCAGAAGVPSLVANSGPWSGGHLDLAVTRLAPGAPVLFVVGVSDQSLGPWPLPLQLSSTPAPGCWLWSSAEAVVPLVNVAGSATPRFSVPPSPPGMLGAAFFGQALVGDPAANPLGLVVSNALRFVVGGL